MDTLTIVIVVFATMAGLGVVYMGYRASLTLFRKNRKRRLPMRHFEPPPEQESEDDVEGGDTFEEHKSAYAKKKKKKKKVYRSKSERNPRMGLDNSPSELIMHDEPDLAEQIHSAFMRYCCCRQVDAPVNALGGDETEGKKGDEEVPDIEMGPPRAEGGDDPDKGHKGRVGGAWSALDVGTGDEVEHQPSEGRSESAVLDENVLRGLTDAKFAQHGELNEEDRIRLAKAQSKAAMTALKNNEENSQEMTPEASPMSSSGSESSFSDSDSYSDSDTDYTRGETPFTEYTETEYTETDYTRGETPYTPATGMGRQDLGDVREGEDEDASIAPNGDHDNDSQGKKKEKKKEKKEKKKEKEELTAKAKRQLMRSLANNQNNLVASRAAPPSLAVPPAPSGFAGKGVPVNIEKDPSMRYKDIEFPPFEPNTDPTASFDYRDTEQRRRAYEISVRRKKARLEEKIKRIESGKVDPIILNSGPHPRFVPKGWRMMDTPPENTKNLTHRSVLYRWDTEDIQGWFIAKIHGEVHGRPPLNWFMKYDIQQTAHKNLNGVVASQLEMAGRFGYGQRWVLLEPYEEKTVTKVVDDGRMQLGKRGPMSRGQSRSLDVAFPSLGSLSIETSFM